MGVNPSMKRDHMYVRGCETKVIGRIAFNQEPNSAIWAKHRSIGNFPQRSENDTWLYVYNENIPFSRDKGVELKEIGRW